MTNETTHDSETGGGALVYVRQVEALELKRDGAMPEGVEIPPGTKLYAVHLANGQRIAVLDNRDAAFAAALQHDLTPVSVH
jgi:hypothetical protein